MVTTEHVTTARLGRPAILPRLADMRVDPAASCAEFVAHVAEAIQAQAQRLGARDAGDLAEDLASTAAIVFEFATSGQGPEEIGRWVGELDAALTSRALDAEGEHALHGQGSDAAVYGPLRTVLSVVMLAARARLRLAAKKPVSVAQLAALASLSRSAIRTMNRSGELRREKRAQSWGRANAAPVLYSDAIKLLASRGVPGFAPKGDDTDDQLEGEETDDALEEDDLDDMLAVGAVRARRVR